MRYDIINKDARILALDIETKPAVVYTWTLFKANIGIEQIITPGGIICVGARWVGSDEELFFSDWTMSYGDMIRNIHALISEADAVLTFNGDRFDIQKLMGAFALEGLAPPPPITSIDVWKTARQLGLDSSRLGFVAPLFKLGGKEEHEGFPLWAKVLQGDKVAQDKMKSYCNTDVLRLVELYLRIRAYIKDHPHMGEDGPEHCGACGSTDLQHRGYRRTRTMKIQRIFCNTCNSWSTGKRTRVI